MNRSLPLALAGLVLGVLSLSSNLGSAVHMAVGGARGPLLMSGLGPSEAGVGLSNQEVSDSRSDFYFRRVETEAARVSFPLRATGPFSISARMDSTVRTQVEVRDEATSVGSSFIGSGPWQLARIAEGLQPGVSEVSLTFKDAPLVQRSDTDNFRRYIDEFVVEGAMGFTLPWAVRVCGGLLVLGLALIGTSISPAAAGSSILLGPLALWALSRYEPIALSLALPRLLGVVALTASLIAACGHFLRFSRADTRSLLLLGGAMVGGCGFLSFLPNHSPADLDIHIWRTIDLADVPASYEGLLRYGSHYPTPSQIRGAATETLGEGPLIPYSPLPYVLFYAAHSLGLDLHWSMNAIEAVSLALLLPLIFAMASAAAGAQAGILAAVLMALDLATIHHLGRAHTPAVVGGALGLAGLLLFGVSLPRIHEAGRWKVPAAAMGVGALGYSSTPLFYALFGVALLSFLWLSPTLAYLRRPVLTTLGVGGAAALLLFYGHYVGGLLSGGATSTGVPDPFPGRTFFVFHNESRQSLRLWRLGLFIPYLGAIPAVWLVAQRCAGTIRPFVLAWIAAWAGIMILKEPWAMPRLLRWAKEDFYMAPIIALAIAIAIGRLESRALRIALTCLAVFVAGFLRMKDYGLHVDTLRFMR